MIPISEAVKELTGKKLSFSVEQNGTVVFQDGSTPPYPADVLSKWEEMKNHYVEKRKAEYPSIQDLVVALYDTDDKSAVEAKRAAVKKKYPKP